MTKPYKGELEKWQLSEAFITKEVFCVSSVPPGLTRGGHAHLSCSQVLIILNGKVRVTLEDNAGFKTLVMPDDTNVLTINPLTWSTQEYVAENSQLLVLCSESYDENEYIRDREQFNSILKKTNGNQIIEEESV